MTIKKIAYYLYLLLFPVCIAVLGWGQRALEIRLSQIDVSFYWSWICDLSCYLLAGVLIALDSCFFRWCTLRKNGVTLLKIMYGVLLIPLSIFAYWEISHSVVMFLMLAMTGYQFVTAFTSRRCLRTA